MTARRAGFVALLGAPNAGKSTLLNRLVGAKVSIVTPKAQTTRSRILGIRNHGATQAVFVDTPGIFEPRRRLERAMVRRAWRAAGDADMTVLLVDAARRAGAREEAIVASLKAGGRQAVLALNKIDLIARERLLARADRLYGTGCFSDVFMVSALTGDGVDDLLEHLAARLPEGPWLYPEDDLSDVPLRFLAAEITREKLFLRLHDEIPYDVATETADWQEFDNGGVRIDQTVYVRRTTQRAIVLGKGGARIKAVREAAQAELADALDRPVHLFLTVRVREGWPDDPERFRDLGLDYNV
ncbi:MAG: GTPase Era [Alphaproteobacteria bacterium]|nr:GTPase Era [Alphaproteobacteria bacterium]